MSYESVTLKDLAAALGVSTTTVHRALNDKGGVSDAMRKRVKTLAREMGYHANPAASALKRREYSIAVLLPDPAMENHYYYASLWNGIRRFMQEQGRFHARIVPFSCTLRPGSHGEMLRMLYTEHRLAIDGLITLGMEHNQSSYFMEKISQAGIPCAILGSDLYAQSRLCCVKADDTMAGNMAAEFLTTFLPSDFAGSFLMTGAPIGEESMVDQYHNLSAFRSFVQQYRPQISLDTAYCPDIRQLEPLVSPSLLSDAPPYAVYASSARHTIQMCHLLDQYALSDQVHLVGNDVFPESVQYLKDGILTALIDKKTELQSYTAAEVLLNFLTLHQYPATSCIQIHPELVLRSRIVGE